MKQWRLSGIAALAAAAVVTLAPAAFAGFTLDYSLSKTHPAGTYTVGQHVTFTLTVHAVSTGGTTNDSTITVTDTLPSGLTYTSFGGGTDNWSCSASGQTVTCTGAPPLNSDPQSSHQDSSFTVTTLIGAAAVPSATNTATLSASGDQDANNNTATDTVAVKAASPSPTPKPTTTHSPKPSPSPSHTSSPAPAPSVLPTSGARLPFSGPSSDLTPLVLAGTALLVLGAGILGYARRRRAS